MTRPIRFDPSVYTIGLDRDLVAAKNPESPGPPASVKGVTFGVATMHENSPHGGEMHPDGDEILYLISGKANVVFIDSPDDDITMLPGDGLLVPKGIWHRVDILEPCQIVYVTPGPNSEHRPLDNDT